jgi:hypothetical protein
MPTPQQLRDLYRFPSQNTPTVDSQPPTTPPRNNKTDWNERLAAHRQELDARTKDATQKAAQRKLEAEKRAKEERQRQTVIRNEQARQAAKQQQEEQQRIKDRLRRKREEQEAAQKRDVKKTIEDYNRAKAEVEEQEQEEQREREKRHQKRQAEDKASEEHAFLRRNETTDEDLRQQLMQVPDVGFQPATVAMFYAPLLQVQQQGHSLSGLEPDCGKRLMTLCAQKQKRKDLVFLPWRKGSQCQLGNECAARLHVLSTYMRACMRACTTQGDDSPNATRLCNVLLHGRPFSAPRGLRGAPSLTTVAPQQWHHPGAIPRCVAAGRPARRLAVRQRPAAGTETGRDKSQAWAFRTPVWSRCMRMRNLEGSEQIRPGHLIEAIGHRSLDRKLWAQ